MAPKRKHRVLFVCIGNACRSPMAESVALHHAKDVIEPSSAGLHAFGSIMDSTRQALVDKGYPIDGLFSKTLNFDALQDADLIVNITGEPHAQLFPGLSNVEDWLVEDPYGADPATYQRILEEIESRVLLLAARLRTQHNHSKNRSRRRSFAKG